MYSPSYADAYGGRSAAGSSGGGGAANSALGPATPATSAKRRILFLQEDWWRRTKKYRLPPSACLIVPARDAACADAGRTSEDPAPQQHSSATTTTTTTPSAAATTTIEASPPPQSPSSLWSSHSPVSVEEWLFDYVTTSFHRYGEVLAYYGNRGGGGGGGRDDDDDDGVVTGEARPRRVYLSVGPSYGVLLVPKDSRRKAPSVAAEDDGFDDDSDCNVGGVRDAAAAEISVDDRYVNLRTGGSCDIDPDFNLSLLDGDDDDEGGIVRLRLALVSVACGSSTKDGDVVWKPTSPIAELFGDATYETARLKVLHRGLAWPVARPTSSKTLSYRKNKSDFASPSKNGSCIRCCIKTIPFPNRLRIGSYLGRHLREDAPQPQSTPARKRSRPSGEDTVGGCRKLLFSSQPHPPPRSPPPSTTPASKGARSGAGPSAADSGRQPVPASTDDGQDEIADVDHTAWDKFAGSRKRSRPSLKPHPPPHPPPHPTPRSPLSTPPMNKRARPEAGPSVADSSVQLDDGRGEMANADRITSPMLTASTPTPTNQYPTSPSPQRAQTLPTALSSSSPLTSVNAMEEHMNDLATSAAANRQNQQRLQLGADESSRKDVRVAKRTPEGGGGVRVSQPPVSTVTVAPPICAGVSAVASKVQLTTKTKPECSPLSKAGSEHSKDTPDDVKKPSARGKSPKSEGPSDSGSVGSSRNLGSSSNSKASGTKSSKYADNKNRKASAESSGVPLVASADATRTMSTPKKTGTGGPTPSEKRTDESSSGQNGIDKPSTNPEEEDQLNKDDVSTVGSSSSSSSSSESGDSGSTDSDSPSDPRTDGRGKKNGTSKVATDTARNSSSKYRGKAPGAPNNRGADAKRGNSHGQKPSQHHQKQSQQNNRQRALSAGDRHHHRQQHVHQPISSQQRPQQHPEPNQNYHQQQQQHQRPHHSQPPQNRSGDWRPQQGHRQGQRHLQRRKSKNRPLLSKGRTIVIKQGNNERSTI